MDATATRGAQAEASTADRPITAAGALAALGIVYGDLGTSPLYTFQTIVGTVGGHPSGQDALGLLSLVVWSLVITVSIKYCIFVLRADNHGEGGILALMALVTSKGTASGGARVAGGMVVAGLFGAALIYGDGIITPAISVLSALEGINVVTDVFKPYVLPGALVVLLLLFAAQMKGTASIGRVFGPIMLLWFVVIAVLGLSGVVRRPEVILAIDPRHAIRFVSTHGWRRLSSWVACSWRLREARHCMPIWDISGASQSGYHGTASCCPRCCFATPGRRRCCWRTLASTATRSSSSRPIGQSFPWWCWRPSPRSLPARPSSPGRSR